MSSQPNTIGRYELMERIGGGGMADLFLARTFGVAGFEKRLVIKRIKEEHAHSPSYVQAFVQEAKIGVHLNHPNIVQIHELGKDGDQWFIAMEYLHGLDLSRIRRRLKAVGRPFPPHLAVCIVAEACRGLAYAHHALSSTHPDKALVHRDVSPHNVLVTFTGEVKVVDFGIARISERRAEESDPRSEAVPPRGGKFAYMSPEQIRGHEVDPRSDTFAAAVVLWELITGNRRIHGATLQERLQLAREAELPDMSTIPSGLRHPLRRALAADPQDRYDDISLLEEDLRSWLRHEGVECRAADRAEFLRQLFPHSFQADPGSFDAERLLDDLDALDPASGTNGSSTSSDTGPMPPPMLRHTDHNRRIVAMYLDIDGLTDLSETAEADEMFRKNLRITRWLHQMVKNHGGTIQRVQDQRALVFFGLPRTQPDDLSRALSCAWEMRQRASELSARDIHIQLAIGIHQGDIILASKEPRVRYAARGQTIQLARRLCDAADHDQILISQAACEAAPGHFHFTQGPWLPTRGGGAPLRAHLLLERRYDSASARSGRWIRRGRELDVLKETLAWLQDGRGSALLLTGHAGVGKSRLIAEVCSVAERHHIRRLTGQASPYGAPFRVFADLLSDILGDDALSADDTTHALGGLGLFDADVTTLTALLHPEQSHRKPVPFEISQALTRLLRKLSAGSALVVVIEDAHHLSTTARRIVAALVERLSEQRVLFLLPWSGPIPTDLDDLRVLELSPLTPALQHRLTAQLLQATRLSRSFAGLVERTCEGNPLYIEELCKYLLAHHLVTVDGATARLSNESALQLPDGLAGLIAARIDALDPASMGLLQLAASHGERFSAPLLAEAIGLEDATPLLLDLQSRGLVTPSDKEGEWSFQSPFVRQAALRGILGVQRRDHHRLLAEAMERTGHPDLHHIALHHALGGRHLRAAEGALQAAEAFIDQQQLSEARRSLMAGLRWLGGLEATPDTHMRRQRVEARLRYLLGRAHLTGGKAKHGIGQLQLALEIAEEHALSGEALLVHLTLAEHYLSTRQMAHARAHMAMADGARATEESPADRLRHGILRARLAMHEGRLDEAEAMWSELQRTASPSTAVHLMRQQAYTLRNLGRYDQSIRLYQRALQAAEHLQDDHTQALILDQLASVLVCAGDDDGALAHLRAALRLTEKGGDRRSRAIHHHHLGELYLLSGDDERAFLHFQRSEALSKAISWPAGVGLNRLYLTWLRMKEGAADADLATLRADRDSLRALGRPVHALTGQWLEGLALAHLGRQDEARTLWTRAAHAAESQHFAPQACRMRRALGRLGPPSKEDFPLHAGLDAPKGH